MTEPSLTITARARAFRPVLLGIILFWVCVFAAFAAPASCSGGWSSPDNSWGGAGTTVTDFCAFEVPRLIAVGVTPGACAQTEGSATSSYIAGTTIERTHSCASWVPSSEDEVLWTQLDLLHAVVGVLWFFALMHGFSTGRVST